MQHPIQAVFIAGSRSPGADVRHHDNRRVRPLGLALRRDSILNLGPPLGACLLGTTERISQPGVFEASVSASHCLDRRRRNRSSRAPSSKASVRRAASATAYWAASPRSAEPRKVGSIQNMVVGVLWISAGAIARRRVDRIRRQRRRVRGRGGTRSMDTRSETLPQAPDAEIRSRTLMSWHNTTPRRLILGRQASKSCAPPRTCDSRRCAAGRRCRRESASGPRRTWP